MGERWHITYDHWKDTAWRDSKNCREHFLTGWIFAHTLVIIYKCVDTFRWSVQSWQDFELFSKKLSQTQCEQRWLSKSSWGSVQNGGYSLIKMTKEEIISMLSKELNSEWTNGVTCLMVENSDSYIPVIVHHNKNELIVEVGEQDKKIYRIGRNELNKTS